MFTAEIKIKRRIVGDCVTLRFKTPRWSVASSSPWLGK
jgi:hypothetical protein